MRMARLQVSANTVRNGSSGALILIGVLTLYNWVLAPHLGCLHAKQRLGAVVGQVAQEKDRICSTLDEKVSQWHTLQREATERDEGVLTADQAKTFGRGLPRLVEEAGCTVLLADFAPKGKAERTEDPNGPVVIAASHLNLSVAGQPEQISLLLRRLGDHRPRIWVDSCQLDDADGKAGRMECSLTLTLYTVEDRKEPARE
jgi:hypothetical protein